MVVRTAAEDVGVAGRKLDGEKAEVAAQRLEIEGFVKLVVPGVFCCFFEREGKRFFTGRRQ